MKTNLQKTIFNLAMNGGSVQVKDLESGKTWIDKIESISPFLGCVSFEQSPDYYFDSDENETEIKPLLHSFNKLTEPVLDGGKVPIDEIRRLFYKKQEYDNGGFLIRELIFEDNSFHVNKWDNYYTGDDSFEEEENIGYDLSIKINNFLKENHFNTENLQPDQFIEIETLKEK